MNKTINPAYIKDNVVLLYIRLQSYKQKFPFNIWRKFIFSFPFI